MGWITLTLRKQTLLIEHNELELEDLELSRQLRRNSRFLNKETVKLNTQKQCELTTSGIKKEYDAICKDKRRNADTTSEEYKKWYQDYADAKQAWEDEKDRIKTEYEDKQAVLEEEATDMETDIQTIQTQVEARMESVAQEIDSIKEQISTDIQNTTIKLK